MQSKGKCVAVVDDDDTFQYITLKTIHSISDNNTVLQFSSSIDALNFLNENSNNPEKLPDLLLLDINMPVIDGWMFLEEFSEMKERMIKPINIFMISSSIDSNDITRANQNRNITEYLMKPIATDKLRELLTDPSGLSK